MTDMKDQQPAEEVVTQEQPQQLPENNNSEKIQVENGISITVATTVEEIISEVIEEETTATTTTAGTAAMIKKIPRADSKLILQNMEEVLKSVKKKHRAKHKRKRELKKLALLEAAAAEKLTANDDDDDNVENGANMKKRHNKKKPLQVAAMENAAAATSTMNNSILQHFPRTPKKQIDTTQEEKVEVDVLDVTSVKVEPKRKTNAFEVMMNARNKSIGGNSPGKEAEEETIITTSTTTATTTTTTNMNVRKQILQNLAERKGAGKRKLEEESRAAYVEQQLENRAKRLKRMLVRNSTAKETPTNVEKRITRAQNVVVEEEQKEEEHNENSLKLDNKTKRKTKKSIAPTTTTAVVHVDDEKVLPELNTRPKRACVTNKRYSLNAEPRAKTRASRSKIEIEEIVEIVDLDSSSGKADNTPKRLAPLFTRGVPKPSPDPQLVQARRNFLQSGVPEKLLLEQTRHKQYQQQCVDCYKLFPNISHIKQLTEDTPNIVLKKSLKLNNMELPGNIKIKAHKFGLLTDCNLKEFTKLKSHNKQESLKISQCRCNNPLIYIPGKRLVAKAWKLTNERFPTFKCYNQLREKYRFFSALDAAQDVQQVSESLVVTRLTKHAATNNNNNNNNNNDNSNDEFSQPPAAAPNGELLFTDKYKPLLFEQVLVNLTPVLQLREFLSNFCQKRSGNNMHSDSEFDTDNESNSNAANMQQNGNAVVLLGPSASGKTNAVFALANEFNFNVLEINAGMKRTGKRLLQELHEATQSHQIRNGGSGSGSGRRKPRQEGQNDARCLILIEDADIAFEQTDAGFVDAIYTLASVSKRPVIIVASNPNCAHLQRLIQQHTIKFALPQALSIARYMSLLSLIENCPVSMDDIVSLYLYNGMNVRRTLLELQLFVQSGGDFNRTQQQQQQQKAQKSHYIASPTKQKKLNEEQQQQNATEGKRLAAVDEQPLTAEQAVKNLYIHTSLFDFYTVDQNAIQKIPYPVDFDLLSNNLNELLQKATVFTKKLSPKKAWLSTSLQHGSGVGKKRTGKHKQQNTLCDLFEQLSAAAMIDAQDQRRCLLDTEFSALAPRRLSADLTHTLVERAIEVNLCPETMPYNLCQTTELSKNTLSEYLSVTPLRGTRACALDWDPIMRNICRYEQQRANDERRSMRFYHYLRGCCANGAVTNFSTNHFDQACNIFHDVCIDDTEQQINQAA